MRLEKSQATPTRSSVNARDIRSAQSFGRSLLFGAMQALLVCVLIAGTYIALPWLSLTFDKPIAKVIIKGNLVSLDQQSIREAVAIYETDTFLTIDLAVLVDRLEKHPWISHARARRQWPDTVELTLVEQKPIAYWGDKAMVNGKGRVFEHQGLGLDRTLPHLWSDLGSPAEIMNYYQIFAQQLEASHLKLNAISQSVQGDWRLQLESGTLIVLDRVDPVGNMKNFISVYSQLLATNERQALVVDMRYRHGASIRWKDPVVVPPEKTVSDGSDKVTGRLKNSSAMTASASAVMSNAEEVAKEWL